MVTLPILAAAAALATGTGEAPPEPVRLAQHSPCNPHIRTDCGPVPTDGLEKPKGKNS